MSFRSLTKIIFWFYLELLVVGLMLQCLQFIQRFSLHSRDLGSANTFGMPISIQDVKTHICEEKYM